MLDLEYLCSQGIPVFGTIPQEESVPEFAVIKLAHSGELSDTEILRLTGNGMHLAVVGSVELHVITTIPLLLEKFAARSASMETLQMGPMEMEVENSDNNQEADIE